MKYFEDYFNFFPFFFQYALGSDPETFTTDPHEDDKAEYEAWKCDLEKREGEISDLMVTSPNIRKNYSSLVPEKVELVLFQYGEHEMLMFNFVLGYS